MPTLADIAKEAGVSVSLVSYVLNKTSPIKSEKHKRIIELANRMQYVSNRSSNPQVAQRGNHVLLVVGGELHSKLADPFFNILLCSLISGLTKSKMRLILYSQNEGTPEDLRSVLLNHSTNGVVWYSGPVPNEVREMIRSTHISFVSVFSDSPGLSSIKVDDFSSEYRLLYHLYELGHRAIAYVGKPLGNRWDAFRKFLQDYDLGPPRILAITDGKNAINIQTFRDHLMNNGLDFTAAVAQSDTTAVAFLSILHHHGIAVPGQVSLAGYDDFPIALECNPPLTTVRQNYSEMARTVTQYLLHSIETGERELFEKVFIHDIVLRASTASP